MDNRVPKVGDKVVIAMSGGHDSAAAAYLLKKQGLDCIGISFLMMDTQEDAEWDLIPGCSVKALSQVQKLTDHLGIPLYGVKANSVFKEFVVNPFIEARIIGRETSPCIGCNRAKFLILQEKAKLLGAKFMASGHYAKVRFNQVEKKYVVYKSNDVQEDQSFLLSQLLQDQLAMLLLPLGEIRRNEAHKMVQAFDLPSIKRPQSGGKCFMNSPYLKTLIEREVDPDLGGEGTFTQIETEGHLGEHSGIAYFRQGMQGIKSNVDTHVIDKNLAVVKFDSFNKVVFLGDKKNLWVNGAQLNKIKIRSESDQTSVMKVFVRVQEEEELIEAFLQLKNNQTANIFFARPVYNLILGHILVFYNKPAKGAKIIGEGHVVYMGTLDTIHRGEGAETPEQDDDGNDLPLVGPDFEF